MLSRILAGLVLAVIAICSPGLLLMPPPWNSIAIEVVKAMWALMVGKPLDKMS